MTEPATFVPPDFDPPTAFTAGEVFLSEVRAGSIGTLKTTGSVPFRLLGNISGLTAAAKEEVRIGFCHGSKATVRARCAATARPAAHRLRRLRP